MGHPQLRRLVQQPANPRIARLPTTGRIRSPLPSLQRVRKPGRSRNDLVSNKPVAIHNSLGRSYDLVIEAAGSETALSLAFELLGRGGTVLALGYPGQGVTIPLNIDDLVNGDQSIVGSFGYSRSAWGKTVNLLNSGDTDLSFIVTHNFALSAWSEALDCLRRSEGVRGKILLRIS